MLVHFRDDYTDRSMKDLVTYLCSVRINIVSLLHTISWEGIVRVSMKAKKS